MMEIFFLSLELSVLDHVRWKLADVYVNASYNAVIDAFKFESSFVLGNIIHCVAQWWFISWNDWCDLRRHE